jgi:hypothetical protein
MSDKVLDPAATTRLVTSLTYLGAGPSAIADLQRRIDTLTTGDSRIVVGEIDTDAEGRPVCGISFNCDSYDPPVDGEPDPRAIADLREIIGGVNLDGCLYWQSINLLTGD